MGGSLASPRARGAADIVHAREVSIGRIPLAPDGAGITSRLQTAARFLAGATAADLMETVFSRRSSLQRALDLAGRIDHVGFIASPDAASDLGHAARAAGFDAGQQVFRSTVLARELGEATGRGLVPTTIFKARGASPGDPPTGVEVAMPGAVEPEVVRGWIRKGIGEHIAFRVGSPSHFRTLGRLMEEEGFGVPAFMCGAPLTNPHERVTTVYFDRFCEPGLRLEFCHYA
jgi:hypothetical protein